MKRWMRGLIRCSGEGSRCHAQNHPTGPIEETARHFEVINFTDRYDNSCSLQQSSLAEYAQPGSSAVWLGVGGSRMHLDIKQVKALIAVLEFWTEHGKFGEG